MTETTVRYTAAELREAAEQIRTFLTDHVTIGGLSIEQTQLVFRQHADMMESPSAKRMTSMREELHAAIDLYKTLSAEKDELLRQLMTSQQHCEYLLATIRQAYDRVRDEQSRALIESERWGMLKIAAAEGAKP